MRTMIPNDSATVWQNLRSLYTIYSSVAREFVIEMQPCRELEEDLAGYPAEAIAAAEQWLAQMDVRIHVHQLRHFLQTSAQLTEGMVQGLLVHHLNKEQRTDQDRDKVDFLLVQLFAQWVPANITGPTLSLTEAAKVLEPLLGAIEMTQSEWTEPLEDLLGNAYRAKSLNELFTMRIIEQGRQIKVSCGEKFFDPPVLVTFSRFGFLIRRAFFHLMHQDLNAILDGLRELESLGVTTVDCRKAQFAADEPIVRLRMICQSWRVIFHAEYSSGQPLCLLVDLRTAVQGALAQNAGLDALPGKARSAGPAGAAGAEFEVPTSATSDEDAPE